MIKLPFQYRIIAALTFCLLQLPAASVIAQNAIAIQPAPAPTCSFVPAQDGAPGSTMTLQQLQQAQKKSEELPEPLQVQPAAEPSPALKYRLFPAVQRARVAETRMLMNHNRLMTLEALRMHAAQHDGELPVSLDGLSPVPAMPDPSSGKAFEYNIESTGEQQTIVLKSTDPLNWKQNQEFRATLVK